MDLSLKVIHLHAWLAAQRASDDAAVGIGQGLLWSNDAGAKLIRYQGMISSDLLDGRSSNEIGAAVAHVGHIEVASSYHGGNDGRAHSLVSWIAGCFVVNLSIGDLDGPVHAARDVKGWIPIVLPDYPLHGQPGGPFPAQVPAHAVGHHVEPALLFQLLQWDSLRPTYEVLIPFPHHPPVG